MNFSSCKKWVIDYRNKWTGDYSFNWTRTIWDGNNWITVNQISDGKVFYRPFHNFRKSITIQIYDVVTFAAGVDKDGNLKNIDDAKFEGQISTSSISFTAVTSGKPGNEYTVTATRR